MSNRKIYKKTLAAALALIMLVCIGAQAFAAPAYGAEDTLLAEALEARRAGFDGSDADWEKALSYLERLTPTQLVHYYASVSGGYYLEHYAERGFRFFDPLKYLAKNPDIAALARESETDTMRFALDQYLGEGILIGKACQTDFDPVVAILLFPDMAREELSKKDFIPDYLFRGYTGSAHTQSTAGYTVLFSIGKDGLIRLYIAGIPGQASPQESSSGAQQRDRTPVFKNALARTISAYTLYDTDSEASVPVDIGGTYYGENYQKIKDSLQTGYTLMVYVCASNQESAGYMRQTVQLMEMLAGDSSNINVIICACGCDESADLAWKNEYLCNDIGAGKAGIYYLDSTKLSDADREFIRDVSVQNTSEAAGEMASKAASDPSYAIQMKNILNADTLVPLAKTGKIDAGDPSLLTGFMNMAADLFPADDYGLILSNHGGGITYGVCSSGNVSGIPATALSANELESALGSSKIFTSASDDGKLGLLFMDACLMSCGELAYSLSDYYRYMAASEETTVSYTDYVKTIDTINSYAAGSGTDGMNLAIALAGEFQSSTWHGQSFNAGSMAVCSSEYIEEFTEKIDSLGGALNELLCSNAISDTQKRKNFEAIYKSALCTFPYYGVDYSYSLYMYKNSENATVDIGEFLSYLDKNLRSMITPDAADPDSVANYPLLSRALDLIGEAEQSGALLYTNMLFWDSISSIDVTSSTAIPAGVNYTTPFWRDLRGDYAATYGLSYYLPRWTYFGGLDSDYANGYGEGKLSNYLKFVKAFASYESNFGNDAVEALIREIKAEDTIRLYSELVRSVEVKNVDGGSARYFSFDLAPSYTEPYVNSFGSPIIDLITTSPSLSLAVIQSAQLTGESDAPYCNMVCARGNVNPIFISVDTNKINIPESVLAGASCYIITGKTSQDNQVLSQFVIASDAELNTQTAKKTAIVKALDSSATRADLINYMTLRGTYNGSPVYHVFDSNANYKGSVSYDSDSKTAESVELQNLSFCHYCWSETADEGYSEVIFEDMDQFSDFYTPGYFVLDNDLSFQIFDLEGALRNPNNPDSTLKAENFAYSFEFEDSYNSNLLIPNQEAYETSGNSFVGPVAIPIDASASQNGPADGSDSGAMQQSNADPADENFNGIEASSSSPDTAEVAAGMPCENIQEAPVQQCACEILNFPAEDTAEAA